MQKTALILLLSTSLLLAHYLGRPVVAQDTFGPTCEKGVTCTPTPTVPRPTNTPRPTATPKIPVTGPMEITYTALGIGGLLLIAGLGSAVIKVHPQ